LIDCVGVPRIDRDKRSDIASVKAEALRRSRERHDIEKPLGAAVDGTECSTEENSAVRVSTIDDALDFREVDVISDQIGRDCMGVIPQFFVLIAREERPNTPFGCVWKKLVDPLANVIDIRR
jgi:hypothetical protein